jgi:hypothetical protein
MRIVAVAILAVACGGPQRPASVEDDDVAVVEVGHEGEDTEIVVAEAQPVALHEEGARMLSAMRTTLYSHETRIDEATGRYDFDCSGFVGYALARTRRAAYDELRAATVKRPLAKHFVEFFQTSHEHWRTVRRAIDLAPGDVIAWLEPSDVQTKNTGHVMIVREAPRVDRKHADVIVVPIIDSTGVPHGKSDSRKATKATGLGTGEVLLIVDETGAPIGYRWSRGSKARVHLTTIALAGLQ